MVNQETEIYYIIIAGAAMGALYAGLLLSKAVHYSAGHQTGLHFQEFFVRRYSVSGTRNSWRNFNWN